MVLAWAADVRDGDVSAACAQRAPGVSGMKKLGMSDELESFDQRAVIKVCGVGGGGGNAVQRMIDAKLDGVEFISINTDAQALRHSKAAVRIQVGSGHGRGLGAGARPEVGREAAEEDRERIREALRGAHMVFLTAGLGGGTGTGAAPIVAEEARASGALTVAVVTLPFSFEGVERMNNALRGLEELEKHVDTLIVVPNDRVADNCQTANLSLMESFRQADEVLHNGVRAISDLITVTGIVNLDFADVRTIMQGRGRALMGIGVAKGPDRAVRAAEAAIVCPLLDQSSIDGATAVLINIKGGRDIGLREVQEAAMRVKTAAHPSANIIWGAVVNDDEQEEIQVTVIATGFPTSVTQDLQRERTGFSDFEIPVPPVPDAPKIVSLPKEVAAASQYLFDEKDIGMAPADKPARHEEKEDIGLPTFLRKRLGNKQQ
jgi:cell division protein FtsZ